MLSITIPKRNGVGSTHLASHHPAARRSRNGLTSGGEYLPSADIVETRESILVRLDLPGVSGDDIDVSLERDLLTIKAERKPPGPGEGVLYHRSEIAHGAFTRAFVLPAAIDRDAIDASHVNGVLTVTLPKAAESKPRSIEVKIT